MKKERKKKNIRSICSKELKKKAIWKKNIKRRKLLELYSKNYLRIKKFYFNFREREKTNTE